MGNKKLNTNIKKTHYHQPSFYKFNSDSIELAKFVVNDNQNSRFTKVGDFFCGCGVIGIEMIFLGLCFDSMVFIESNSVFIKHLEQNQKDLLGDQFDDNSLVNLNIPIAEYMGDKLDLIVANPPYFYPDKNRITSDENKKRARFFVNSNFYEIVECITTLLSPKGVGYILYRIDQIEDEKGVVEVIVKKCSKQLVWDDSFFQKTGLLKIF